MKLLRRLRLRDEGGFSLIEMLVVVVILGIVLGGITTVFISGSRAEVNVNDRFQAQEAARLGMAGIRQDVHSACAAYVKTGTAIPNSQLTLSVSITNAGTPPDPESQCGTVNGNITKIFWCVATSPTNAAKFALYRSTTSCAASLKLVADNLVNNLTTPFLGFFQTIGTATAIRPGEFQTIDVDIPVSLKVGTSGAPFDLEERLALSNTTWTNTAAQACSVLVPCTSGPCPYKVEATGMAAPACFVPPIS